ncbi:MAG: phosphotransferase family protein [Gemmatimonadaceae bacterium]|nr:phosphotransferase family protein [Gemmatimonadaceae bacterium]
MSARPTPVHGTVAIRAGEEIDADVLRGWLTHAAPHTVPAGAVLTIRQFPAGFSNLTYLVTVHHEHGEKTFVLRRPPFGAPGGVAHDMPREHGILAALHPLRVPVPRPVAVCTDAAVIGAPFYMMEHVEGLILRGALPPLLAESPTVATQLGALSRTCAETLAQLHAVPIAGTSLASLGRPEGYVQRQVEGWIKRWHTSRTEDVPAMDDVAAWLSAHRPPDSGVSLVHNDFKLDNLVLEPDASRVRAILDWEMATIGDPLMDLGTTLAYWVEAGDAPIFRALGLGVTAMPGAYTRAQFVAAYADARGIAVPDVRFYVAFGRFKVAVIAQQIYARFVRGLTTDARFGRLGEVVEALGGAARSGVEG